MSENNDDIICPNCESKANGNYCFQCGQPTHLHDDTFLGLIGHFIAHEFHFESKFWQTMKALWFNPGKLTIAYTNKQRARYIAPVSLYILISAIFFLITTSSKNHKNIETSKYTDSIASAGKANKYLSVNKKNVSFHIDLASHGEEASKIFFFMIPIMALFLQLLFIRRRHYFVNHNIYFLHFHSFLFSLLTPVAVIIILLSYAGFELPAIQDTILSLFILLIMAIYLAVSLHKVYNTNIFVSILFTILIVLSYFIFLILTSAAYFTIVDKFSI